MKRALITLMLAASALSAQAKEVLPFIQNDYTTALSRAKAKHLPIFVEAWAPW